jgi:hypothetical protein
LDNILRCLQNWLVSASPFRVMSQEQKQND